LMTRLPRKDNRAGNGRMPERKIESPVPAYRRQRGEILIGPMVTFALCEMTVSALAGAQPWGNS